MKTLLRVIFCTIELAGTTAPVPRPPRVFQLTNPEGLQPQHVTLAAATYQGKRCVQVVDTARGITSARKYALLRNFTFHNGTIEVEVAGKPTPGAAESARGFVGLAFRIAAPDTAFECVYVRPTNGRAEDQVRRNHATQYTSYPDYPWEKLRQETPGKYESYVDLVVGRWTKLKLVVHQNTARLYVDGAQQPALVVLDLKHGAQAQGGIGLWIGSGTEAYFRQLVVTPTP